MLNKYLNEEFLYDEILETLPLISGKYRVSSIKHYSLKYGRIKQLDSRIK